MCYIINHCDQWHTYESFRFIGVVEEGQLIDALKKIKKECGYDDDDMEKFININEVELNDLDI